MSQGQRTWSQVVLREKLQHLHQALFGVLDMQAHLLPFSYSKVCKTPQSGQLFLLLSQLPSHGNLWIDPPVSVPHRLHRRFYVRS